MTAKDTVIVMTHSNKNSEVMEQNKASFARHNPGVDILTPCFTPANLDAIAEVCPGLWTLMEPCSRATIWRGVTVIY